MPGDLAVESQQVVPGQTEPADRYLALQATMRSVPVVSVEPDGQLVGAVIGGGICLGIGPFAQRSLDEAFGLAVGLRGVWPGVDVLEAEAVAGFAEGL